LHSILLFVIVKLVCENRDMDIAEPNGGKEQRAIQSIEVGGRLLLALSAHPTPMSLKDLAASAQMPASRAHPYLVSYGRLGLVTQDPVGGRYALGPAALQLGLTALHQCDPVRAAEPVADELASRTGQAVAVVVWGNFGPTVIRMIDARQPLHVTMRAGTVMSSLGTATGRAFAGAMRDERLEDLMTATALGGAPAGRSRPGANQRKAQVAEAREEFATHGCTRAVGRPIPGINAFSAPAFDHSGEVAIVLTILGHQDNVSSAWSSPGAAAFNQAAADVSNRLGYRPEAP
jgi:DNA-binding IclR family transcriptional regulator